MISNEVLFNDSLREKWLRNFFKLYRSSGFSARLEFRKALAKSDSFKFKTIMEIIFDRIDSGKFTPSEQDFFCKNFTPRGSMTEEQEWTK